MFGREQPGVEDGEVGWDDGEEQEKDSYDLGDVQAVVSIQEISQDGECDKCSADYDAGYGLCPGFVIIGKHLGTPFFVLDSGVIALPI
jgi:hypothetical protein